MSNDRVSPPFVRRSRTGITGAEFEAFVRRAGLSLTSAQIGHLLKGWALVEPMLDRIRSSNRERTVEPAHVFRADAYTPASSETETP